MKTIIFAKESFTTPVFENISSIADIPPPNINLNPEDPICTIYTHGKTRKKAMNRMDWAAVAIYSYCHSNKNHIS